MKVYDNLKVKDEIKATNSQIEFSNLIASTINATSLESQNIAYDQAELGAVVYRVSSSTDITIDNFNNFYIFELSNPSTASTLNIYLPSINLVEGTFIKFLVYQNGLTNAFTVNLRSNNGITFNYVDGTTLTTASTLQNLWTSITGDRALYFYCNYMNQGSGLQWRVQQLLI